MNTYDEMLSDLITVYLLLVYEPHMSLTVRVLPRGADCRAWLRRRRRAGAAPPTIRCRSAAAARRAAREDQC